jgi:hypothetical protein
VPDQEGLDALRGRVERRTRAVPPPRNPRPASQPLPTTETARTDDTETAGPNREQRGSAGSEPVVNLPALDSSAEAPPKPAEPAPTPPTGVAEPPPPPDQSPPVDFRGNTGARGTEPTANLTLRIRQSLDLRLAELTHGLRREGVRSSKKELIEMCLFELPTEPTEHLRARLRSYRENVPKEPL